MNQMLAALPRVVPLLARHALGYADLATEELEGIGTRLRRRMIAAAMCVIAASFAVQMVCAVAVVVAWNTEYRIVVLVGLALSFLAIAIGAGEVARREQRDLGRFYEKLISELNRDREALRTVLAERESHI